MTTTTNNKKRKPIKECRVLLVGLVLFMMVILQYMLFNHDAAKYIFLFVNGGRISINSNSNSSNNRNSTTSHDSSPISSTTTKSNNSMSTATSKFMVSSSIPSLQQLQQQQQQQQLQQQRQQQTAPPPLLLDVPFYVYEMDLVWENATFGNVLVSDLVNGGNDKYGKYSSSANGASNNNIVFPLKHTDDYYFMKASLSMQHPMRVDDPIKAEMFVVPMLLNTYYQRVKSANKHNRLCVPFKDATSKQAKPLCNTELLTYVGNQLQNSIYFKQHPERHVLVASHYARIKPNNPGKSGKYINPYTKIPPSFQEVLDQCSIINFENRGIDRSNSEKEHNHPKKRIQFPKLYVGETCESNVDDAVTTTSNNGVSSVGGSLGGKDTDDHYYDAILVATIKPDNPLFETRTKICEWTNDNDNTFCGATSHTEYCPILTKSKFGFHVRGDTYGSSRLVDLIVNDVIPIFTHKEQYDILPPFVDWNSISYYIEMGSSESDRISKEDFLRQLDDILQDKDGLHERKKQALLGHKYLLDWQTNPIYPFDMYMNSFYKSQQQQGKLGATFL